MLSRIVFATHYMIPIESDLFDVILLIDKIRISNKDSLSHRLNLLDGVAGVSYNMYMGNFISLSVEKENDGGLTWDLIDVIIKHYVGDNYVS